MSYKLTYKDSITNLLVEDGVILTTSDTPTDFLMIAGSKSQIGVKDGQLCLNQGGTKYINAGIEDKFTIPIDSDGKVTDLTSFYNGLGNNTNIENEPIPDYLKKFRLDDNDSGTTPVNSPSFVTSPALSDRKGVLLNGVDEYMDCDASAALINNSIADGPFAVSYWVKLNASGAFYIVSASGDPNTSSGLRHVIINDGSVRIKTNGVNRTGSIPVDDGNWHFVVINSAGTGGAYSFYIDGSLDVSGTMPAYDLTGEATLKIGASSGAAFQFFDGVIDDVRYYDRELTASEISVLFEYKE